MSWRSLGKLHMYVTDFLKLTSDQVLEEIKILIIIQTVDRNRIGIGFFSSWPVFNDISSLFT